MEEKYLECPPFFEWNAEKQCCVPIGEFQKIRLEIERIKKEHPTWSANAEPLPTLRGIAKMVDEAKKEFEEAVSLQDYLILVKRWFGDGDQSYEESRQLLRYAYMEVKT